MTENGICAQTARVVAVLLAVLTTVLAACSTEATEGAGADAAPGLASTAGSSSGTSGASLSGRPASLVMATSDSFPGELEAIDRVWTGDLDGMLEDRVIRFLLVYSNML